MLAAVATGLGWSVQVAVGLVVAAQAAEVLEAATQATEVLEVAVRVEAVMVVVVGEGGAPGASPWVKLEGRREEAAMAAEEA